MAAESRIVNLDELIEVAHAMSDRPPLAKAVGAPPAGARGRWLVIVEECPFCRATHAHRAIAEDALFAGEAVRDCSVTKRSYTLFVTQRTRAARRA